ncbi:MAG TPA: hypothetical protein DCX32_04805 [Candidatus Moranbacteria bacterium]|nr:MAG: hypothetical protein UW95_C0021G0011 [Parcubacteria group bacterium GW2011_GWC1_45_14]HAV11827.1 hypothetical protein [Candidatus Moranbacteria bacterium]
MEKLQPGFFFLFLVKIFDFATRNKPRTDSFADLNPFFFRAEGVSVWKLYLLVNLFSESGLG